MYLLRYWKVGALVGVLAAFLAWHYLSINTAVQEREIEVRQEYNEVQEQTYKETKTRVEKAKRAAPRAATAARDWLRTYSTSE